MAWKKEYQVYIGEKYHLQSQGAVEGLTKLFKDYLNEAYTNSRYNRDEEWFLHLIVNDLLHYYNSKRVHLTIKMIPIEILFN